MSILEQSTGLKAIELRIWSQCIKNYGDVAKTLRLLADDLDQLGDDVELKYLHGSNPNCGDFEFEIVVKDNEHE